MLQLVIEAIRGGVTNQQQIVDYVQGKTDHGIKKIRNFLAHFSREGGEISCRNVDGKHEKQYSIDERNERFCRFFSTSQDGNDDAT